MRDWLDYLSFVVQVLLLAGLVWYTIETRRIRKTSQEQVEATLRPCVSLSTTARDFQEAVLGMDEADSAVVLRCPQGMVQIENIGVGPAFNIRYEFRPLHPELTQAHPVGYVAGISKDGTFLIPVARTLLAGHDFECLLDYQSVNHRNYRTAVTLINLAITAMRFEAV
jgi:hypothetical protein